MEASHETDNNLEESTGDQLVENVILAKEEFARCIGVALRAREEAVSAREDVVRAGEELVRDNEELLQALGNTPRNRKEYLSLVEEIVSVTDRLATLRKELIDRKKALARRKEDLALFREFAKDELAIMEERTKIITERMNPPSD